MNKLRIKQNTAYKGRLEGEIEFLITHPDGRQVRVWGSSWSALWLVLAAGVEIL